MDSKYTLTVLTLSKQENKQTFLIIILAHLERSLCLRQAKLGEQRLSRVIGLVSVAPLHKSGDCICHHSIDCISIDVMNVGEVRLSICGPQID